VAWRFFLAPSTPSELNLKSQISNLKSIDPSVIKIIDSRQALNVENGGGQQQASKRAAEPVAVKLKELRFCSKQIGVIACGY
ncbi:hypothetical protein QUA54_25460, partial [Microcoleus sp. MOSTC5]|uniref:hypothetical protein n=1 Tax=Microcoleus sp. MOSTC5 TaxID=3055378 RepID=UPI002FD64E2F